MLNYLLGGMNRWIEDVLEAVFITYFPTTFALIVFALVGFIVFLVYAA